MMSKSTIGTSSWSMGLLSCLVLLPKKKFRSFKGLLEKLFLLLLKKKISRKELMTTATFLHKSLIFGELNL